MFATRCPWYIAGPLLGLLIVGLRLAVNRPLGALGGYISVVERATGSQQLGFNAFLLLGTIAGGALFSTLTGTLTTTWSYSGDTPLESAFGSPLVVLALAGLAMGFGARTAGGCTSGHGLSGNAIGSPASVVSTITFFATAVGLSFAIAWLSEGLS